jgi:hypothetical protein
MLRRLSIECPRCHLVCLMHLGTEAPAVVVRCPSCETSIMAFGGEVYVLNEQEAEAVRRGDGGPVVERMLARDPKALSQTAGATESRPRLQVPHAVPVRLGDLRGSRAVTYDDILDLHMELESCTDSLEFVTWLRNRAPSRIVRR